MNFFKRYDAYCERADEWIDRHLIQVAVVAIIGLIVVMIALPIFVMIDTSRTVARLMIVVANVESQHEEQRTLNRTTDGRIKALADEQKWIREQNPVSRGVSLRHSQMMEITAYTCHVSECGKLPGEKGYCTTAAGLKLLPAHNKKIVAADPKVFKAGTKLMIEGVGLVTVSDTGSTIKGNRLDLFWDETDRAGALKWGRQYRKVTVLE